MNTNATLLFCVFTLFTVILFDVAIYLKDGVSQTISAKTWVWSKKYPIIVLGVGIVLGHLFWH